LAFSSKVFAFKSTLGLAGGALKYGNQLVGAFPDQLIGPMQGPMRP